MQLMKIKGTAVKSIQDMVKKQYPKQYDEWFNSLPSKSKQIFSDAILATEWYDLIDAGVNPTQKLAMFFNNDSKKAAWESGRHSADIALKGIYKVFVKMATPAYIIARASKIFSTYYMPSAMGVHKKENKAVIVRITEFPQPSRIIEYRIAGWMERALELSGCKNISLKVTQSLVLGGQFTEFSMSWD